MEIEITKRITLQPDVDLEPIREFDDEEEYEVIGNIHENPELLEEEEC